MRAIDKRILNRVLDKFTIPKRDRGLYLGMTYAKLRGADIKYKEIPESVSVVHKGCLGLYEVAYASHDSLDDFIDTFKEYICKSLKDIDVDKDSISNIVFDDAWSLSYDVTSVEGEYTLSMLQDHNKVVAFLEEHYEYLSYLYSEGEEEEEFYELSPAEITVLEWEIGELQERLARGTNNEH